MVRASTSKPSRVDVIVCGELIFFPCGVPRSCCSGADPLERRVHGRAIAADDQGETAQIISRSFASVICAALTGGAQLGDVVGGVGQDLLAREGNAAFEDREDEHAERNGEGGEFDRHAAAAIAPEATRSAPAFRLGRLRPAIAV